jgi:P4 family phage/plasmid primase-like protien
MPDYLNPFRDTVNIYRQSWWRGTVPLPYKAKHPPPTGFTGHAALYPDDAQINEWRDDGKRHNIGIRLAGVDKKYELIGIDVDHYQSGEKTKRGGDQLQALESTLGRLPETWISSARKDGQSGIRYFRVPRGLAFRGQVDKDIECISKGYRFAVVWPSVHPDEGVYQWYRPGCAPDGVSYVQDGTVPVAKDLPLLPEKWIDHLTAGKMRASDVDLIDMDSSVQQIYDWADATFHEGTAEPCKRMRKTLELHKKEISEEATSHDKIVKAHMAIFHLAREGHVGWNTAINEIEEFWTNNVIERDKRGLTELRNEVFRSRTNGLRKVKADIDTRIKIGAVPVDPPCHQSGVSGCTMTAVTVSDGDGGDPLADVPMGATPDPADYEMNHDGNGQHLVDLFRTQDGASFRWVEGLGWIVWHDGRFGGEPHWQTDRTGDGEMRRLWRKVKQNQLNKVINLKAAYDNEVVIATNAGSALSGMNAPAALIQARESYRAWKAFSERSGDNKPSDEAMRAARSLERGSITISINDLDKNPLLLGVANGVLELDADNVRLRRARQDDYITMNTGTPWEEPSQFAKEKWQEFLDLFLPDKDLQEATQVALGHCLIGGNPEKTMLILQGPPNTGKSTIIATVEAAMGDYAESVSSEFFQSKQFNTALSSTINKRIVSCSEFDEQEELSPSIVKRITGGTDKVSLGIKHSMERIVGVPQCTPILATNETPKIEGADKALFNRLHTIPFVIVPKTIKKDTANIVKNVCATACLHWLVEGFIKYKRIGFLPKPKQIEDATNSFFAELDDVGAFLAECVHQLEDVSYKIVDDKNCINNTDMYKRFEQWCMENSYLRKDILNQNRFSRRLKAMGLEQRQKRVEGKNGKFWLGVRFRQQSVVIKMNPPKPESDTGNADES